MKPTKITSYLLSLFIISILLNGCERSSVEHLMYGTWDISIFLSNEDFEKLSEEPISDGVKEEFTLRMEGTQSYHRGGKYNSEGEITMRYESNPPLRFQFKEVGDWSLHDNGKDLVETTSEGVFTALDEFSEEALKELPDLAAWLKPLKGQTTTNHILSISETVLVQEDDETKFTFTMKKKR